MFSKTFSWLQDVHDRALFYYRLLQHNVTVAQHVVDPPKQAVSVFADTQSSEIKDRIFDEFNSLSVVYQKVSKVITLVSGFRLQRTLWLQDNCDSCIPFLDFFEV